MSNQLRLLVPLDDTRTSLKALEAVRHMADSVDRCVVELIHVEPMQDGVRPDDWRTRQTHAEDFLARAAEALSRPHLTASWRVAWGDPAQVILERAQRPEFDFICMTTRAVPDNADEPGSVASRLFREAVVPIIALPANHLDSDGSHQRAAYRARVHLPATFEAESLRHPLAVVVRDIGPQGSALETDYDEPLPADGGLLILSLPNRQEPLEIVTRIASAQHLIGESGGRVQTLHASFPMINPAQQDAIVAFINQLRVLQQQQRRLSTPVSVEVITGPRAFASFKGKTAVVRPDYVWLHMDRFDHIEAADVALRVYSPNGKEKIDVDGTVTSVKAVGQEFDAEVELAPGEPGHTNPGEKLMAFLRQHYRPEPRSETSEEAEALIPRPIRAHQQERHVARVATAWYTPTSVPMRPAKRARDVPYEQRARQAQEHAVDGILKPRRKSAPLRSL